jgi:hypothetical protein
MRVGNEQSFVSFEFKEAVPEHLPCGTDVSYKVEASCHGFGGRIESVWFTPEDIIRFLSELRSLEETREGSANLVNLSSPSEDNPLRFEMYSIDSVGHFAVRADLSKYNYVGADIESVKVSVSFRIDAGDLPSILIGFRKLFDCK